MMILVMSSVLLLVIVVLVLVVLVVLMVSVCVCVFYDKEDLNSRGLEVNTL